MDTKKLLADAKARYSHLSAKAQLRDKYKSKLIVADQGGLWEANLETLNFLFSGAPEVILLDTFDNPVKVNRVALRDKLETVYTTVMEEWHTEWLEAEKKR